MPEPRSASASEDWAAHLEREERALPRRRGAAAGRRDAGRAPAPAHAHGQRRERRRARAAHAGPHRRRPRAGSAAPPRASARASPTRRPAAGAGRSARSRRACSPATGPGRRTQPRWALEAGAAEARVADRPLRGRPRPARARPTTREARVHADAIRTRDDFPARRRRRARATSPPPTCSATPRPSRRCSSRSRRATSTSRTCPSPTPCSCSRRSPTRRGLAAELSSPLLPLRPLVALRSGVEDRRDRRAASTSGPRARAPARRTRCHQLQRTSRAETAPSSWALRNGPAPYLAQPRWTSSSIAARMSSSSPTRAAPARRGRSARPRGRASRGPGRPRPARSAPPAGACARGSAGGPGRRPSRLASSRFVSAPRRPCPGSRARAGGAGARAP